MADEKTDVKSTEVSSTSTTAEQTNDVKETYEQAAERLVNEATEADSSTETEASPALNQSKTEEEAATEEVKETETETSTETETKADETTETKTEEAVPYPRFKEVNDKVASLEPMAKAQQDLANFCQKSGITPEVFRETMEVLALEQNNPGEAIKRLESKLETLRVANGSGLPADLRKEVEEGTLSEARAKELAKLRLSSKSLESQQRQTAAQQEQQQQQFLVAQLERWATDKAKLDPSFKPKAQPADPDGRFEDFLDKFARFNMEARPSSLQDYIANAEKAFDMLVKRTTTAARPVAKKALSSNGASRRSTEVEPKTPDDVMKLVAQKHGYTV